MQDDILLNVINHAIGVIGYFDCRATGVEQDERGIHIHWDHYGTPDTLELNKLGDISRPEGG